MVTLVAEPPRNIVAEQSHTLGPSTTDQGFQHYTLNRQAGLDSVASE